MVRGCVRTAGAAPLEMMDFSMSHMQMRRLPGRQLPYTRIESTDNYDRIYQTDPCGWQGSLGYGKEMCWFANRYEAEEAELLAAVGFYATGTDTTYEIYFQPDGSNGREERTLLQAGSVQEAGYYTVDLEKAIALSKGEAFLCDGKDPYAEEPISGGGGISFGCCIRQR